MTSQPRDDPILVVNLYPDQADAPASWRTEDLGSPSVLFRCNGRDWVAHLEKQAVLRAAGPEELAAELYRQYDVLAVLHPQPFRAEAHPERTGVVAA